MQTKGHRPRDLLLLIVGWGVSSLAIANIWATYSPATASRAGWPDPALVALIASFALLPVCIFLSLIASGRRILNQALRVFQRREALLILLLIYSLGEISLLLPAIRKQTAIRDGLVPIGLLIILWMLLGPRQVRRRTLIPIACWLVAVTASRRTLGLMIVEFDLMAASWRTQILALCLGAGMLILALAPLSLLSQPSLKRLKRLLARYAALARLVLVVGLAAMVLILGLNLLSDWEDIRLTLVAECLITALVLATGWMSLDESAGMTNEPSTSWPPNPRWVYGVAVVVILALFLTVAARIPQGDNPDSLAYMSIARSYADGDWPIRGYWSPLLSWLMVPAILVGVSPETSYLWVARAAGVTWIVLALLMARRMGLGRTSQIAVALLTALVALSSGIHVVTPDLLSAACVLLYLYVISHPRAPESPFRFGALAGLAGGLAYFAKAYNFPFFIASLLATGVFLWGSRAPRRAPLLALASGLVAFIFVSAPWIAALASRYGQPTITTSSGINRAIVAPASEGHLCWSSRLCGHLSDVLFPWEDPLPGYYRSYGWSPLDDLDSLRYQIQLTWTSLSNWAAPRPAGPSEFPPIGLFVIALAPFAVASPTERRKLGWLALVFVLYMGGYLLTFGDAFRYYLPIVPVFWIGVFVIIEKSIPGLGGFIGSAPLARWMPVLVLLVPLLSFSWLATIRLLTRTSEAVCLRDDSSRVSPYLVPPIVGTDAIINYVSYQTRTRTFGVVPAQWAPSEAAKELQALNVQTVLAGENTALATDLPKLFGYTHVADAAICGASYSILRSPGR